MDALAQLLINFVVRKTESASCLTALRHFFGALGRRVSRRAATSLRSKMRGRFQPEYIENAGFSGQAESPGRPCGGRPGGGPGAGGRPAGLESR